VPSELTNDERREKCVEIFEELSMNEDYVMYKRDFWRLLRALDLHYSDQEVNRVYRLIDGDKSGSISTDEFIEMLFPAGCGRNVQISESLKQRKLEHLCRKSTFKQLAGIQLSAQTPELSADMGPINRRRSYELHAAGTLVHRRPTMDNTPPMVMNTETPAQIKRILEEDSKMDDDSAQQQDAARVLIDRDMKVESLDETIV